jgi:hypothetical protein
MMHARTDSGCVRMSRAADLRVIDRGQGANASIASIDAPAL